MDELVKHGYMTEMEREKMLNDKRRNYRDQHAGTAASKGKSVEFRLATTLTEMRAILWGQKK